MSSALGGRRAIVALLAVSGFAAVSGGSAANASFGAHPYYIDNRVHASNGTTSIYREGQSDLHPVVCEPTCAAARVTDVQWSADGTRAVFVNQFNQIETYHDNAEWWGPTPAAGTQRRTPTFDQSGRYLIWSERSGTSAPWHLSIAPAASSFVAEQRQLTPDDGYHYTNPDAGRSGVVYQRNADSGGQPSGTPEVWLASLTTGLTKRILTNASQPTLGSNGDVAFVRSDGEHLQIFRSLPDGTNVEQLTTDAADHTNPSWSPDSSYVTYNVDGQQIGRVSEGGSQPGVVPGMLGVPTYRWEEHGHAYRLQGATRFETAAKVSQSYWAAGKAKTVVLSRSDVFADALGGATLAAAKQGPLLLTEPGSLNALTAAEIVRVLPKGSPVYLLGSTGAISGAVESTIRTLGYTPVRLAGADRYATSVLIAKEITDDPELILAATGENFPDALAASAAAGAYNTDGWRAVVVLTRDDTLPAATATYLDANADAQLFPIGVQAVAATAARANVAVPIAGSDRYETAAMVADVFFPGTAYAGVATGTNWPDALAGAALMGTFGAPLLLTDGTAANLHPATAWALSDRSAAIQTPLVFGSAGVLADPLASQVNGIIQGDRDVDVNPTNLPLPPAAGSTVLTPGTAGAKAKPAAKPRLGTLDAAGRR